MKPEAKRRADRQRAERQATKTAVRFLAMARKDRVAFLEANEWKVDWIFQHPPPRTDAEIVEVHLHGLAAMCGSPSSMEWLEARFPRPRAN